MSMIASDIATIPSQGFSWYVLFLEDTFDDPIKNELSANFLALGRESGRDALVVRGYDPTTFFKSAYETLTLYQPEWAQKLVRPALLISDTSPALLLNEAAKLAAAKLILIPLATFRGRAEGTMTDFLRQLAAALRDPDAIRALSHFEQSLFSRKWAWLGKYLEIKPSFMGFGVDVNRMLKELV